MAFKSESHQRWWFANHGAGGNLSPVVRGGAFGMAIRRFNDDWRAMNLMEARRSGRRLSKGDRNFNAVVLLTQRAYSTARSGYNGWQYSRHINENQARARSVARQYDPIANGSDRYLNSKLRGGMNKWQSWNRVNYWERRVEVSRTRAWERVDYWRDRLNNEKLKRHGWA